MENEELINKVYENAKMGIIGIDEVLYKIQNPKLLKEINKIKKDYSKICLECEKYLEKNNIEKKEPSNFTKISSEIMTQMKLMKDNCDEIIIDMMIKGTEKSINILNKEKIEKEKYNREELKVLSQMYNVLTKSLLSLKKFL